MRKKIYFLIFVFFLLSGEAVKADIPSLSGDIEREFPWYSYFILGVFLLIVGSISMVLLAKIKYRKKKSNDQNNLDKK